MNLKDLVKEANKIIKYRDYTIYGSIFIATKSFGIVEMGSTFVVDEETNSLRGGGGDRH